MRESLKQRCELYIKNRDTVKKALPWGYSSMYPLCAGLFTNSNKEAQYDKLKESKNYIKKNAGLFSNIRGITEMITVCQLSMENNAEEKFEQVKQAYKLVKKGLRASTYGPIAAYMLTDYARPVQYEMTIEKAKNIYSLMKSEHPFLTGSEDVTYALLFALSDKEAIEIVDEAEACYQNLKGTFHSRNNLQALSHVLALGDGSAESKCKKVVELYHMLQERGAKYGTSYELATLGVLTFIDADYHSIVDEILEIESYLRKQKGFGAFSISRKQRLMFSVMILMGEYIESEEKISQGMNAVNNTIAAIILAQEVACTAAAAAAAASASS